jgi:hypothetical protein
MGPGTGGSIPGLLEQLPLSDLNATGTYSADPSTGDLPLGIMFEKVRAGTVAALTPSVRRDGP